MGGDGQRTVILFDGVCNLCNASVQFIIRRDTKRHFLFASLQSEAGQRLLKETGLPHFDFDTFVVVEQAEDDSLVHMYTRSDAAIQVVSRLRWPWPLARIVRWVPRKIRDGAYGWVSRNRYRWFGKRQTCMIPTLDIQERFLQ